MVTASSLGAKRAGQARRHRLHDRRRVIRQASAWLPSQHPRPARLQELEESTAIRWVDLYGGDLRYSEAQALLNPVCNGELSPWMVRDLIGAGGSPAAGSYGGGRVSLTATFRTRHLPGDGGVASVFEPVRLLAGDGWLLSCWLSPRVYRGLRAEIGDPDPESDQLYGAVAEAWVANGGESAADLAESVHRELAVASGEVPQPA